MNCMSYYLRLSFVCVSVNHHVNSLCFSISPIVLPLRDFAKFGTIYLCSGKLKFNKVF